MIKPEVRCIQGRYSIWMGDKCIHGEIYTEGEAKSYLASYEGIYYAGCEQGCDTIRPYQNLGEKMNELMPCKICGGIGYKSRFTDMGVTSIWCMRNNKHRVDGIGDKIGTEKWNKGEIK